MGKVEIKIRKKILTPDNVQQYRNYPALLKKYERNKRFKRALKIFLYSLALTIFVLALIFLGVWKVLMDKSQEKMNPEKAFLYLNVRHDGETDTVLLEQISKLQNDNSYIITYNTGRFFTYKFPIDSSFNTVYYKMVASRNYVVSGTAFTVKKYITGDLKRTDGFAVYFYSPDFGILHIESIMWYSRTLISVKDSQKDVIIEELIKMMQQDKEFYDLKKF